MKLRTLIVLGFLGIATLACGGGAGVADYGSMGTELTTPWTEMSLPIDDGTVLYSDDSLLTLNYSGADTKALGEKWAKAVEGAGYTKEVDASMGGIITINYKKDGRTLVLNVADMDGTNTVSLTMLDK